MTHTLSYERYQDKVLAGWIGKSIGGVIGAPLENHKFYHDLTVDRLWPETVGANDDLDIQIVWLEAMQERGVHLTARDLAEFWQDRCFYNFLDYGYFLYNYQRGIGPPLSGTWNNRFFEESEGCPIRSEIWGFVCPGNPRLAAELARLDGQLDHGGLSVEIEMVQSAAAAQAFVCDDLERVLAAGLSVLPAGSRLPAVVSRVRGICAGHRDPYAAWRLIIREYGDRDSSKAITNFALVLMALFLGGGDFRQTTLLCANGGWDTDCTAATACALLAVMLGTEGLPSEWVERLDNKLISDLNVRHKNALLVDFAEETCRVGVEMAAARNRLIELTGAPSVTVRPAPRAAVGIEVEYPADPVLWRERATPVRLIVRNPLSGPAEGVLRLTAPSEVVCDPAEAKIVVPAKGQQELTISVVRRDADGWLADKNLFEARWMERGGEEVARTFGLGGARQWQVYGPYWDAWDRTRTPVCPYYNETTRCHPHRANCAADSYTHYVQLDRPYLDESRLVHEDIPSELPLGLEAAEDRITASQLGGFVGPAVYYFVRTFRACGPLGDFSLAFGRVGPLRVWIDGEEAAAHEGFRPWCPVEFAEMIGVKLDGHPRRLVVKALRLTDAFTFSLMVLGTGDPERKRGISWMHDGLEDRPVGEAGRGEAV